VLYTRGALSLVSASSPALRSRRLRGRCRKGVFSSMGTPGLASTWSWCFDCGRSALLALDFDDRQHGRGSLSTRAPTRLPLRPATFAVAAGMTRDSRMTSFATPSPAPDGRAAYRLLRLPIMAAMSSRVVRRCRGASSQWRVRRMRGAVNFVDPVCASAAGRTVTRFAPSRSGEESIWRRTRLEGGPLGLEEERRATASPHRCRRECTAADTGGLGLVVQSRLRCLVGGPPYNCATLWSRSSGSAPGPAKGGQVREGRRGCPRPATINTPRAEDV
jgi:hypothetical protein